MKDAAVHEQERPRAAVSATRGVGPQAVPALPERRSLTVAPACVARQDTAPHQKVARRGKSSRALLAPQRQHAGQRIPHDTTALRRWARQLASNHRAVLPALIQSHEDLGNFLASALGAYLAGEMTQSQFRDVCGWAIIFLRNVEMQRAATQPNLVVR